MGTAAGCPSSAARSLCDLSLVRRCSGNAAWETATRIRASLQRCRPSRCESKRLQPLLSAAAPKADRPLKAVAARLERPVPMQPFLPCLHRTLYRLIRIDSHRRRLRPRCVTIYNRNVVSPRPERWQSGRMRRFAKPLYGLTPVPRVRIPPSPPFSLDCRKSLRLFPAECAKHARVRDSSSTNRTAENGLLTSERGH